MRPLLHSALAVAVCAGGVGMVKAEGVAVEVVSGAVTVGALVGLWALTANGSAQKGQT